MKKSCCIFTVKGLKPEFIQMPEKIPVVPSGIMTNKGFGVGLYGHLNQDADLFFKTGNMIL